MRKGSAILGVLVLLGAGSLRADVAPFPSWRVAANGTIMRAVQAGPAVYVAGTFTKIGRAIPPFGATLDPATLSFVPRTDCAQSGTEPVPGRYVFAPAGLSDGAGPFPVPPGTAVVRVGIDCRFDRRFRVIAPPGAVVWPSPLTIEVGDRAYFHAVAASTSFILEVDRTTGAMRRYWPSAAIALEGVLPDGRLLAKGPSNANTSTAIGVFDPDTGQFTAAYTAPGSWTIEHVGAVVVLASSQITERELLVLDSTLLTPLPQWPVVRAHQAVYGSGQGRLFIAAPTLSVAGVATPHLIAFDTATGARLNAFVSPWWLDDAYSRVAHLAVVSGRVVALGEFAAAAPRDTAAAFDAASGALDPWVLPFATPAPTPNGGLVYFPVVDARDRVARSAVAAVDAATGTPLPWTAAVPLTLPPFGAYALAADSATGHLYVGAPGSVRRYDLATGQLDQTWGLDTDNPSSGWNQISDIAVVGGTVYVSGSFARVRDNPAAAWQPREGAAAITTAGALTAWQPQVRGNCVINVRPTGINFPCVSQLVAAAGRLVMQGTITRLLAPDEPTRSAMAVTADSGAVDGFVPVAPSGVVAAITTDGTALFATARLPALSLARVDAASGPQLVGPLAVNATGAAPTLALHAGRIYADLERDPATASPTGNPMQWRSPVAAASGVLDIDGSRMSHHADVAQVAPQPPTNLTADYDAATVRLRWAPGTGDLTPLVSPPSGGTAATSHVISASLTSGGTPVAHIDTGSAETAFSIAAPTGTFYVHVQARNAFGTSAPSAALRVDVQPQAPEPPLATTAVVSGGRVRIQWQGPPRGWPAERYRLEAGTAMGLVDVGTLDVAGLSFDGAVPPGRYYVRVRAVNAHGTSVPGDDVVIDVP